MAMVYKWKVGKFPVTAQTAGEELERIEQDEGYIIPEAVVERSRPEDAPLHNCFEWDDSAAAEEYRKVQAREIIRYIEVVREEDEEEDVERHVRAFWSTYGFDEEETEEGATASKHYAYRSINRVLDAKEHREYVLGKALRELLAFERKYRYLNEFAGVMGEIDKVKQQSLMTV